MSYLSYTTKFLELNKLSSKNFCTDWTKIKVLGFNVRKGQYFRIFTLIFLILL